jgi:hypothetical protein
MGRCPAQARTLETHHLATHIKSQRGAHPAARRAKPYLARQNAAAERCPIAAARRLKRSGPGPTDGCVQMFPRLARDELLGFEHAEGFPQCAEALIELPVEIHLARQKPKLQACKRRKQP